MRSLDVFLKTGSTGFDERISQIWASADALATTANAATVAGAPGPASDDDDDDVLSKPQQHERTGDVQSGARPKGVPYVRPLRDYL